MTRKASYRFLPPCTLQVEQGMCCAISRFWQILLKATIHTIVLPKYSRTYIHTDIQSWWMHWAQILYTYMHTHTQINIHSCIHTYIHTSIRTFMHKFIPACMHTCMRTGLDEYWRKPWPRWSTAVWGTGARDFHVFVYKLYENWLDAYMNVRIFGYTHTHTQRLLSHTHTRHDTGARASMAIHFPKYPFTIRLNPPHTLSSFYTYISIWIYVCIHAYNMNMYVYMYTYMHAHWNVHIHTCVDVYTYTCTCMYTCTYVHWYTYSAHGQGQVRHVSRCLFAHNSLSFSTQFLRSHLPLFF